MSRRGIAFAHGLNRWPVVEVVVVEVCGGGGRVRQEEKEGMDGRKASCIMLLLGLAKTLSKQGLSCEQPSAVKTAPSHSPTPALASRLIQSVFVIVWWCVVVIQSRI